MNQFGLKIKIQEKMDSGISIKKIKDYALSEREIVFGVSKRIENLNTMIHKIAAATTKKQIQEVIS